MLDDVNLLKNKTFTTEELGKKLSEERKRAKEIGIKIDYKKTIEEITNGNHTENSNEKLKIALELTKLIHQDMIYKDNNTKENNKHFQKMFTCTSFYNMNYKKIIGFPPSHVF